MSIASFETDASPRRFAGRTWPTTAVAARKTIEFLAVGGAALILLPLAMWLTGGDGESDATYAISFGAFYAAYVINDPHFASSYLIFYKNFKEKAFGDYLPSAERWRYRVAGIIAPVALLVWIAAIFALQSWYLAALLIHIMFITVGWHYVKQGFGVLSVLSSRDGVRFTARERGVLLTHCYVGWIYGWSMAMAEPAMFEMDGIYYWSAAIGWTPIDVLKWSFWASGAAFLVVMGLKLRREGRLPPIAALTGFLVSIWLWVVYTGINEGFDYVIPALHSIQYFFFIWLLKSGQARDAASKPVEGARLDRFVYRISSAMTARIVARLVLF
ncbi:MAG: hypothetical protein AAGB25_05655, partial [Pseudomonadota bacterium]